MRRIDKKLDEAVRAIWFIRRSDREDPRHRFTNLKAIQREVSEALEGLAASPI